MCEWCREKIESDFYTGRYLISADWNEEGIKLPISSEFNFGGEDYEGPKRGGCTPTGDYPTGKDFESF